MAERYRFWVVDDKGMPIILGSEASGRVRCEWKQAAGA